MKLVKEYSKKKVAITGYSGFIGKKLLNRLVESDCSIVAIGRTPCEQKSEKGQIQWLNVDLEKESIPPNVYDDIDVLFHLAGPTMGSGKDPIMLLRKSEFITINLLRNISEKRVKIVYASSQVVYGNPKSKSIDEGYQLNGWDSAYASSKLNTENWIRYFQRDKKLQVIALRLTGFINGGGLIDYLLDKALLNEDIELYSSGKICRDYLLIDDAIYAFLAAGLCDTRYGFFPFNIGSGDSVETAIIAQKIKDTLSSDSKIILAEKEAMRGNFVFNINAAREALGFMPSKLIPAILQYTKQRKLND